MNNAIMNNNIINKIIKVVLTLVQVLILVPPLVLQYLSDRKMGIMRYLVFKKRVFSEEMFAPNLLSIYKIILILGIILCAIFLIYNFIKKINTAFTKSLVIITTLEAFCIFYMVSLQFQELLAYHFFLIAIFVIIILECIKLILTIFQK